MPIYIDTSDLLDAPQLILAPVAQPIPSSPPPPPPTPPAPPPPAVVTTVSQPILQPGILYIDTADVLEPPALIVAPQVVTDGLPSGPEAPSTDGNEDSEPSARGPSLVDYGDPLEETELDLFGNPPLQGQYFVVAMRAIAAEHDLDPLGMAANGIQEGFSGAIGDGGMAYGPWQDWMTGYRGRPWYGKGAGNNTVNRWAWSRDGIEYVARAMVNAGAAGIHGERSAYVICMNYERPTNTIAEALSRQDTYRQLAAMPSGVWDFIAGLAKGPVGWSGAQTAPPTPPPVRIGANSRWKDLLDVFGKDVPNNHARVKGLAGSLTEVFK